LEAFDRISSGHWLGSTVPILLSGEYSRRLLLVRHIVDTARGHPDLFQPGPTPDLGWSVLQTAQSRSASKVHDLICHPTSGLWATHTTRRLAGVATDEAPIWIHLAHLSSLAASAALLTGLDTTLRIPVRHGVALLPLLGHARLPATQEWTLADLRIIDGVGLISLPDSPANPVRVGSGEPGWTGVRTIRSGTDGQTMTAALETIDPYPGLFGLTPSSRASDRDDVVWGRALDQAWNLLVRDHAEQADGLTEGLRSIIPLDPDDPAAPASGSAADAFGAAALCRPPDPVDLAVALVHEFQHSVLNGLLHLVPLVRDDDRLFYAPWRDDPRSLTSLLHGAYAFSAVTRFWRTRRTRTSGASAEAAQFEFALWRSRTETVLTTLLDAGNLTEWGKRFVDRLDAEIDLWLTEDVSEKASRAANLAVRSHYAAWRVHHLQPDPTWVSRAAESWRQGIERPAPVPAPPPALRADHAVPFLDNVARLYRDSFSPNSPDAPDSGAAEAALLAGEADRARHLYLQEISRNGRSTAWGGLGLALAMAANNEPDPRVAASPGAQALITRPESVRALHLALGAEAEPPSVLDLARWVAGTAG
jgi:HEXXH motif-containing protein